MDRWDDADDGIEARPTHGAQHAQGRVARLGMGGFVKADTALGAPNAQSFGKIEVVASKRERRQIEEKAEAARLMPPPKLPARTEPPPAPETSAVQSTPAATGPPKLPVPEWAAEPPAGSRLLVYKDGHVIQELGLGKVVTVFGRVEPLADVVLDHPSISRQHAALAFSGTRGVWLVTDLGSTHGTFVGEQQLKKNDPTELQPGAELRFAASTRRYRLPPAPAGAGSGSAGAGAGERRASEGAPAGDMPPPPPKRPRVSFADDSGDTGGRGSGGGAGPSGRPRPPLETVIGFSDGRDFVAKVGPKVADPGEGKFASAVVATTIVVSPKGGGGGGGGGGGAGSGGGSGSGGSSGGGRAAALQAFAERIRTAPVAGPASLPYDFLPPPAPKEGR
ncbi:hypothetical protein HYH03_014813 [Edaphochlamys debaryana]|uniref:FHA domain-containing protein n=1 Tax=Edaphochlamys debaryana TaxID=47281 RepID=A0A835XMC7_9CHLO|nr:hypothetical protein HYH03_014813 [Edaphochlamys debaryana]|eukprot:KAG2486511.1 hypothetical protein HYH03_014813 [Edaphochlamys debaryana]